ncbi:hypothetical protein BPORC_1733 [Bifidobacterium porcinum]|nr:hypothetical protein BPORC_1733 [Bifidobacterium porcinum]
MPFSPQRIAGKLLGGDGRFVVWLPVVWLPVAWSCVRALAALVGVCCGMCAQPYACGSIVLSRVLRKNRLSRYAWPVGCWWSCVTAGCIWRVVYVVACTIRQMPAGLGFCGDVPQVVCVVGYVPRDSYDSTWVDRPSATVQWCQCEEWRRRCVKMGSHSDLGT